MLLRRPARLKPLFTHPRLPPLPKLNLPYSTAPTAPAESITQRLRRLFRENGKVALLVYLGLSAVDLGLTFVGIYTLGADHVRDAEDWVLKHMHWKRRDEENLHGLEKVKDKVGAWAEKKQLEHERAKLEAQKQTGSEALWTSFALAYAIHKTALLPIRVGLTAAITPGAVKYLRRWGFNVGPSTQVIANKAPKIPS